MITEKLSSADVELMGYVKDSTFFSEVLFTKQLLNHESLKNYSDDSFAEIRLYQLPYMSYEYLLADDPELTDEENFHNKQSCGRCYAYTGRKTGKCEFEDNNCNLADGSLVKFKDLKGKTAKTLSLNSKHKIVESSSYFKDNGVQPCHKIITRTNKEKIVTSNHSFLTSDGWKEIKDIVPGEYIAMPRKIPVNGKIIPDYNTAKLLGYLLGDGSTSQACIGFTNINQEIIDEYYEVAKYFKVELRKYDISYYAKKSANSLVRSEKNNFKKIVDFYKIDSLAKNKIIPQEVFKWNNKGIAILLNRLFACDGHVNYNKFNIELCLASEKMVKQVQELLLRFEIHSGIYYKKSKCNGKDFDAWRLLIANDFDKFLDVIGVKSKDTGKRRNKSYSTSDRIPKNIFLNIEDKLTGIKQLHNTRHMKLYNSSRDKWLKIADNVDDEEIKNIANSDIFWEEVKSVEYTGVLPTVAVQTKEHRNYISDGFISHNTLIALLVDLLLDTVHHCTDWITLVASFDDDHVANVCEPYIATCKQHPFFKLFQIKSKAKPYRITTPTGHLVKGINMNLGGREQGCLDEQTEMLTDSGWKTYLTIKKEDKVLSVNPKNLEADYFPINTIINEYYDGKMIEVKNNTVDLKLTPHHNMFFYNRNKKDFTSKRFFKDSYQLSFIPSKFDYKGKCSSKKIQFKYRINRIWTNNKIDYNDWCLFLGWFISEGWVDSEYQQSKGKYRIFIAQSKAVHPNEYNEIVELLKRMGLHPNQGKKVITVKNKEIYLYLAKHVGRGSHKKRVPDYLFKSSKENINAFLDSYTSGDGKLDKNGQRVISTANSLLGDDIQRLFLLVGKNSTKSKYTSNYTYKGITVPKIKYDIRENIRNKKCYYKRQQKYVDYKGIIWCVNTEPHHSIVIRRNGKVAIVGNSYFESQHACKIVIDEHQYETQEVVKKRSQATSEYGTIERFVGITNFTKDSPAGNIFFNIDRKNWLVNLPQTVSPAWTPSRKAEAIADYGDESSPAYKIHVKAEVIQDMEGVYDIERLRKCYYPKNKNKPIKHFEFHKDDKLFDNGVLDVEKLKRKLIVERPPNASMTYLASDFGENITEIIVVFEMERLHEESTFKYVYNISLYKMTPDEQTEIFKYLIVKLEAEMTGIDASDSGGKQIYRNLNKVYPAKNLHWVSFQEKIDVDVKTDEKGRPMKNGKGEWEYEQEYITDWSIARLKKIFYEQRIDCLYDLKLDKEFNNMVCLTRIRQAYKSKINQDHLHQAFQVFAIMEWKKTFCNRTKPKRKAVEWGTGVCS